MGRVQSRVFVLVCVDPKVVFAVVVVSDFGNGTWLFSRNLSKAPSDYTGRDSSHRRIETMRKLQTGILHATTTCIAQTRALQFANNAQSPPVECTHHAHAMPAMCAREIMRCFVVQDPLRRCVFGSSERAVRRFRISRSRH